MARPSRSRSRSALVTGCSTGIGAATVDRLVARGWHVYASVRKPEHAEALRERHGAQITVLEFDITDEGAVREAGARILAEREVAGLDGVVANAGIAIAGPLEFLPLAELRRQLEVNVVGQVAVAQAVLPALRIARGRIVLIGSISGRSAMPFVGAYGASKHALEGIADAWRVELAPWHVQVSIIEPGVIATPVWASALHYGAALVARMPPAALEYYGRPLARLRERAARGVNGRPPEIVAAAIEHALTARRPRARYVVGRDARTRVWLQRLPVSLRDRLIVEGVKRL
ncbi:MAG TPA: SDR family oxidoreductase [Longimicrobiales bacterium]|nr:SDR family oxidoreductase [Longimicrobiales bacterium]